MSTPSELISGAANAAPHTPATQSPQATNATANAVAPTPPVFQSVLHEHVPNVTQGIQAAQLEHTSSTTMEHGSIEPSNCALAGGATAPQSPLAAEPSPSGKKRRGKQRRDNHVSVRCDEDLADIVARRMERTGETQSNAVRSIIRESEHSGSHIYLTPKAPPEQLEIALGDLRKWRRDFATAKPRLSVPTPKDDDSRHAEVQKWRKEADRLLTEIPKLERTVAAAIAALTCLTPQKVDLLKKAYPLIEIWKKAAERKGERKSVETLQLFRHLIEDMGMVEMQAVVDTAAPVPQKSPAQENYPQGGGQ